MKISAGKDRGDEEPMRPFRFSIRSLMVVVAVVAVEWLVVVESARMGLGTAFTLFIGSALALLDILYAGFLAAADRVNRTAPEDQAGPMFQMGCFLALIMIFSIPVALVVLLAAKG